MIKIEYVTKNEITHLALFDLLYKQAVFIRVKLENLQYDNRDGRLYAAFSINM